MRVVSGIYRGRAIRTVDAEGMRPATQKVREALFSALAARGVEWEGARVLDLFAGSGSLGLEALSRGAAEAVFVELHRPAAKGILATCKDFGVPAGRAQVLAEDVLTFLTRGNSARRGFDVCFIDPPYHKNLLPPAVAAVAAHGWVHEDGFLVAEVETRVELPHPPESQHWALCFDRAYGQTRILIWTHTPPQPTPDADASPSIPAPSIP
ncbi:16S rRNA (guanine(966)-N(2))-methyltransferase RsmD [Megalodesulfovibrio gigas]|uniref:Putative N6-adenine-specific methylase n=2 Tax=Megalodesulfovibrio gigas TaxID=879 RepID=T2G6R9_MEGG1|nr:16S rRNA (guanine(966)-N(2))-methyltransferase RsmD [Megalodesulfovibrio gigas]AAW67945.1 putative N6-adenine-specific methylase [Megalodesulfovibrio gigas]AGW11983.1 putative N6-adenine-specific methylase [Megalodesulfovibrio gigas DSM 1382 = ATCC 19364]